jgi:hypothetical protein
LPANLQEELLSRRRSKSRVVIAVLMRFLQSLSRHTPLTIINKAGSHRTAHFDNFSSLTLVEAHGRKDSTVGRWTVTRVAERLMQMAVRLGVTSRGVVAFSLMPGRLIASLPVLVPRNPRQH